MTVTTYSLALKKTIFVLFW